MFGQEVMVKAQPAKTVVKAVPAASLKREFWGHISLTDGAVAWQF
jgi:hypothetical protein